MEEEFWMRRALVEARRGRGFVEPNPMVGSVVIRDGHLVGLGHHERFGGPHAEVNALGGVIGSTRGATLYVTLEPCCHWGKTPPCVDAILAAGIGRVVVAMADPFPRVAGGGLARLRAEGVQVSVGLLETEARELNAPYLKRVSTGRPYVVAKWAMTLDGKIATRTGHSAWISSERSRAMVHEVRGRMDAIVVGIGTAIADDPRLTVRPSGSRTPTRVVVDSLARIPVDGHLVRTARDIPVLIAVGPMASPTAVERLESHGVTVVRLPSVSKTTQVDIGALLDELGRRGMTNILVEGGGRLIGSFFDAGEVDEVDIFLACKIDGGTHDATPVRGRGAALMSQALQLGDMTWHQIDNDIRVQGRFLETAGLDGDRP